MKHIFEYLFSKKSDLDRLIPKKPSLSSLDIVEINHNLYMFFDGNLDEYFAMKDQYNFNIGNAKYGLFYWDEKDDSHDEEDNLKSHFMYINDNAGYYDDELKFYYHHKPDPEWDVKKIWKYRGNPKKSDILKNPPKFLDQEFLKDKITSKDWKLIWKQ